MKGVNPSNYNLVLISDMKEQFDMAFSIVFNGHQTATHYYITADGNFILFWAKVEGANPLPYPMQVEAAREMVWEWLKNAAVYGPEPDHDGSNYKGFRIETGDADGKWQCIVRVQPCWAEYWK